MATEWRGSNFEAGSPGGVAMGSVGAGDSAGPAADRDILGVIVFLDENLCERALLTTGDRVILECPLPGIMYSWHWRSVEDARSYDWPWIVGTRWGHAVLCSEHAAILCKIPEITHVWAEEGTSIGLVKG